MSEKIEQILANFKDEVKNLPIENQLDRLSKLKNLK